MNTTTTMNDDTTNQLVDRYETMMKGLGCPLKSRATTIGSMKMADIIFDMDWERMNGQRSNWLFSGDMFGIVAAMNPHTGDVDPSFSPHNVTIQCQGIIKANKACNKKLLAATAH